MRVPVRLSLLLLLLAGAGGVAGQTVDSPVLEGVVVGVVDGDTADVRLASGMVRVRFHAIDAPEMGQPHGRSAKSALSGLIYGRAVSLEPFEQDRYDRLVARVWLGRLDVNAEMVRNGHAWTYRRYATDPAYCGHEQSARGGRLGLWRAPAGQRVAPWEWRQRRTLAGEFTNYDSESVAACIASLGH